MLSLLNMARNRIWGEQTFTYRTPEKYTHLEPAYPAPSTGSEFSPEAFYQCPGLRHAANPQAPTPRTTFAQKDNHVRALSAHAAQRTQAIEPFTFPESEELPLAGPGATPAQRETLKVLLTLIENNKRVVYPRVLQHYHTSGLGISEKEGMLHPNVRKEFGKTDGLGEAISDFLSRACWDLGFPF